MRLALFQPDIPQNLGAAMRIAACFGVPLDVIEPCGFPLTDKGIKRASMDYDALADVHRHESWKAFRAQTTKNSGRLVLFTTTAKTAHWDFAFQPDDVLLFGRESAGVPPEVHAAAAARIRIPLAEGARSLNLAVAAGIGLAEAVWRTGH